MTTMMLAGKQMRYRLRAYDSAGEIDLERTLLVPSPTLFHTMLGEAPVGYTEDGAPIYRDPNGARWVLERIKAQEIDRLAERYASRSIPPRVTEIVRRIQPPFRGVLREHTACRGVYYVAMRTGYEPVRTIHGKPCSKQLLNSAARGAQSPMNASDTRALI